MINIRKLLHFRGVSKDNYECMLHLYHLMYKGGLSESRINLVGLSFIV